MGSIGGEPRSVAARSKNYSLRIAVRAKVPGECAQSTGRADRRNRYLTAESSGSGTTGPLCAIHHHVVPQPRPIGSTCTSMMSPSSRKRGGTRFLPTPPGEPVISALRFKPGYGW